MDVKKGILCLLFGGTRKEDDRTQKTKLRSEVSFRIPRALVSLWLILD